MAKQQTESEQDDRKPTERVVLEQVRVLLVPENVSAEKLEQAIQALVGARKPKVDALAWVERGVFTGTRQRAIEAFAGEAGTPDARPGTYRAPGVIAWKGAIRYVRPEAPKVEREILP